MSPSEYHIGWEYTEDKNSISKDIISCFRLKPLKEKPSISLGLKNFNDIFFNIDKLDLNGHKFKNENLYGIILKEYKISQIKVIRTIKYRLDYLYNRYKTSKNDYEKILIQLIIDSHIPLVHYIIYNKKYFDEDLVLDYKNNICSNKSVIKQYNPEFYELNIPFYGNLPNFTNIIDTGNLWYDIRPITHDTVNISYISGMISCIIHLIISKTQNHRCQIRSFLDILIKYINYYPEIIYIFIYIIQVSLLGNYLHSKIRPHFIKRIGIYHSFYKFRHKTSYFLFKFLLKKFIKWMTKYDSLVYVITKEFYICQVEFQYTCDIIFNENENWLSNKKYVFELLDEIRNLESISDSLNLIKEYHSNILKKRIITKLKKEDFISKLFFELNNYSEKKLTNLNSNKPCISKEFLKKNTCESLYYKSFYFSFRENNYIPLNWLKNEFNFNEENLDLLKILFFNYEIKNIPDNAIIRTINKIYNNSNYDFHLLRTFLKYYSKKLQFRIYWLTNIQYKNQKIAIRKRYNYMEWEKPLKNLYDFYYCPSCQQWSHSIINQKTIYENKDNLKQNKKKERGEKKEIYSLGLSKAIYDLKTDSLYCEKNFSNQIKQSIFYGLYFGNTEIHNKHTARTIRKHKESEKCSENPLIKINMLGTIQKLNSKLWCLCEICGHLIEFTGINLNANGWTCYIHKRDKYSYISQIVQNNNIKNCYFCNQPNCIFYMDIIKNLDYFYVKEKIFLCKKHYNYSRNYIYDEKNQIRGGLIHLDNLTKQMQNLSFKAIGFTKGYNQK